MKKSRFESKLWASRLRPRANQKFGGWRLEQDLIFWSSTFGYINVPRGFETDFASVPRLPFMFWFFGDRAHAAAVVHDYLCRHHYPKCKISWRHAADIFHEAMCCEGVPLWQRLPMTIAVRFYGLTRFRGWC